MRYVYRGKTDKKFTADGFERSQPVPACPSDRVFQGEEKRGKGDWFEFCSEGKNAKSDYTLLWMNVCIKVGRR